MPKLNGFIKMEMALNGKSAFAPKGKGCACSTSLGNITITNVSCFVSLLETMITRDIIDIDLLDTSVDWSESTNSVFDWESVYNEDEFHVEEFFTQMHYLMHDLYFGYDTRATLAVQSAGVTKSNIEPWFPKWAQAFHPAWFKDPALELHRVLRYGDGGADVVGHPLGLR